MADRFSTPPRRVSALAAPSPVAGPEEITVEMAGDVNKSEIHLTSAGGTVYNEAFSLPFADAFDGETFRVMVVELEDMVAAPEEITFEMVDALTGAALGPKKVTKSTRLMDVRSILVGAMAGDVNKNAIHLISTAGTVHNKAFSLPFADAFDGEIFQVVMVELEDMVYLDMGHRRE
jgi:hypothetical protein